MKSSGTAPLRRTGDGFLRPSSGVPGRDRPGATFRSAWATGTASSSASAAGRTLVSLSVFFLTRYRTSSTSSTCSLTARSSRLARRRRAQRGDPRAGDRLFPGQADQQDCGRRGRGAVPVFPSKRSRGTATGRCTSGGTRSRSSSQGSKNSVRWRRAATRRTGALRRRFTSSPAWSRRNDCQQDLGLWPRS